MKGKPFRHRLGFAWGGLRAAFRNEASFRAEVFAAIGALGVTAWLNPPALWWALVIIMIALVLAAELANTALEHLLDGLHPEQAEFVRIAKDCSAAAVLVFSTTSVAVFALMLLTLVNGSEKLTLRFDCTPCEMHVMGKLKPAVAKAGTPLTFYKTRP